MPAGDGGSFITTGGGGGGGGGGVLNPDNKPKWSTLMADAMKNRAQSTLDLEARRQASQTAAKQAVTSRLDSEARQIADRTAARNARGVYGPDGSAITGARKVRVTNDTGKLKELEDANYYKNQQANIDKQYEADLASAALQTGTSVQQLKDRIQQRLNPKPYVAPKKRR